MTGPIDNRWRLSLCCLCCLALLPGCSDGRPDTIPVSGQVKLDGEPHPGARITFWAPGASRPAAGTTDDQGNYTLTMFDADDGAMPGKNTVCVIVGTLEDLPVVEDLEGEAYAKAQKEGEQPPPPTQGGTKLSTDYADPLKSPVTKVVTPEGPNTINIEITTTGGSS